jgi:hypothetical protein
VTRIKNIWWAKDYLMQGEWPGQLKVPPGRTWIVEPKGYLKLFPYKP